MHLKKSDNLRNKIFHVDFLAIPISILSATNQRFINFRVIFVKTKTLYLDSARYNFVEMHPPNSIEYEDDEREEATSSSMVDCNQRNRRGRGRGDRGEEAVGRGRNPVVNHRQYEITGKSAINQGSPGTELGNCLLKNRNDVNPGVPASERASGRTNCRSMHVHIYISAIRKIKLIRPRSDSWVE